MKAWLGTILLVVTGSIVAASGCGNPEVINNGDLNGSAAGGNAGTTGSGASGGTLSFGDGGANAACPSTCDELNANCGFVTDTKCGGVVKCGTCTVDGEVCGGQEPNRCGKGSGTTQPDAGTCTPSSCKDLGAECGSVSDPACPGTVVDCGNTKCPGMCVSGKCTTTKCTPKGDAATLCAQAGLQCGSVSDGCDGTVDCGSCSANEACSNGVCNPTTCPLDPKTTCAGRGYSCGLAANNCGVQEVCGPSTCPIPGWTCGGGSDSSGNAIPGVCGCTGACSQIPTCDAGTTTTLTGKVYDPAGRNPLYHVLVYVANNPSDPNLKTFTPGITCDVCGATAAGSPLVSTPGQADPPAGEYTGVDGSFTLKNVPAGNVTLVIQLGRWRRTFTVNVSKACQANPVPDKTLLMPANQTQGNIPLMAMVTGNADSLECVLRKMGIDKAEFTNPGGGGRVNFFLGDQKPGQAVDKNTPTQDSLFTNNAINNYDMTILACQGGEFDESAHMADLRHYAAAGGRVFATHYSYAWLRTNNANVSNVNDTTADNWSQVAKWHVDGNDNSATDDMSSPTTGIIDKVSNPKGNAFQGWLEAVGASVPNSGTTTVYVVRHDTDFISTVPGMTQQWLYRNGDNARSCAVTGATCTGNGTGATLCAPKVCSVATTQACNSNNDCTANVCSNNTSKSCNRDSDCGGNNRCRANTCKDNSCQGNDYTGEETPLHFTFNTPVNLKEDLTATPPQVQCGRVLFSDFHVDNANENATQYYPSQCALNVSRPTGNNNGTCTKDSDCTGTCTANKCPWGTACTSNADCASSCSGGVCLDPMSAQEKLLEYMIFDLGSCVPPTTTCTPKTTCPAGQDCGYAPDGCGGLVACGTCPTGETCGVPTANKCGTITCTPKACPSGQECGFASDGCSSSVNCGTCPTGQTCNNGKCGSTACTPKSCTDQGIECGQAGDDCGNVISCPTCPAGDSCIAGKCVPLTCTPKTCKDQGIACGQAADGCGNLITDCGDCPSGDLCVAGQCVHVN